MTNLAIDLALFFCVLAFATGKRWPMMLTHIAEEAEYWRKLAREAQHRAERTANVRSKQIMLKAAQTYDLRAEQVTEAQGSARIASLVG